MSSKTPVSAIIFLVVSLAVSVMLSVKVTQLRDPQVIKAPESKTLVRAGFNKFLSQIAWMRLIQFRGGLDKVTKENAADLIKKYENLTNLDPMFAAAYEEGALDLGWQDAEQALKLLDRAMQVDKLKNWKIPFTAGFIAKMRLTGPNDNGTNRAIKYLEKATKISGCPSYVHRYLINLKAEACGNDPVEILNLWVNYYSGGSNKFGEMSRMGMAMLGGGAASSDSDRKLVLSQISRISAGVIADSQKALAAEKDAEKKKAIQGRIDEVQKIVKTVYTGSHVCLSCYRPYGAGDRYCPYDGKTVEVFGVCTNTKCGALVSGTFCTKCGTKVK